jgi:hypothetical protein
VLHPRHKLQYFKDAGWSDEWIEQAEEIVRDEFNRKYASLDLVGDNIQPSKAKVRTIQNLI